MNKKIEIAFAGGFAFISVLASGCGGGSSKATANTGPTIVVVNGYRGYYSGQTFCYTSNNYCGTGNAYSIVVPTVIEAGGVFGYYSGTEFCSELNSYCGTSISWGILPTNPCQFLDCGGVGSTGSAGTIGSAGTNPSPGSSPILYGSAGWSGSAGSSGLQAVGSSSKDVGIQKNHLQQVDVDSRAQALVNQFSMSFSAAQQLTQLSDRFQALSASGNMTDDDKMGLADATLGVAGIKHEDVVSAWAAKLQGDNSKIEGLLDQAASNIGMPSSAALRDQILPSVGLPQL